MREQDTGGFLYLTLDGSQEEAYMELDDEKVDPDTMFMLDCDAEGTGLEAKGVSAAMAGDLIRWIGPSVRPVFPA